MRLFHVTLTKNLESIGKAGIDPQFARGARNECWYVTASKLAWAILHVMNRHKVGFRDVVVLECLVPQSRLRRRWRGIYTTAHVVPPLYLSDCQTADDVAGGYPQ